MGDGGFDDDDDDDDDDLDEAPPQRLRRLALDDVSDVELLYKYPDEDEILEGRRGWWS